MGSSRRDVFRRRCSYLVERRVSSPRLVSTDVGEFPRTLFHTIARDLWQRVAVAGSVFTLGVALEVAQYVYYDNPLEWWDIRDDGLGVLAAVLATWLANYLRARAATSSST